MLTLRPLVKIVFAIDYEDYDGGTMYSLEAFADIFNAEAVLLHVNPDGSYFNVQHLENYKKTLYEIDNYDHLKFEFVGDPNIYTALENYIQENQSDIIAMKTRKSAETTSKESLTRKMVNHTAIPLLAFHE